MQSASRTQTEDETAAAARVRSEFGNANSFVYMETAAPKETSKEDSDSIGGALRACMNALWFSMNKGGEGGNGSQTMGEFLTGE